MTELRLEAPEGGVADDVDAAAISPSCTLSLTRVGLATLRAPGLRHLKLHDVDADTLAGLSRFPSLETVVAFGERVRLPDTLRLPAVVDVDFTFIVDNIGALAGCPNVEALEFITADGEGDIRALADAGLGVRHLKLRGARVGKTRPPVTLPPEIAQLAPRVPAHLLRRRRPPRRHRPMSPEGPDLV